MANYVLSADGSAVVRLTPQAALAASSLSTAILNGGFTATTGTAGSLSVTTYAAEFSGGNGGAQFTALYNLGTALGAGQSLNWVQVVTTNDPLGGAVSPYLDNRASAATLAKPFYSYTTENRTTGLPANQLNFYDFSTRPPGDLSSHNPITWSASLYPVIVNGTTLTVEGGESWGWTMKKAMVGSDTGVFVNPTPSSSVVSGVGTSSFAWGTPDPDASSVSFVGGHFDTTPNTMFKLGTITYHNGTTSGGEVTGIEFDVPLTFDNVPEKNFTLKTNFGVVTTPNTDDPIASADQLTIGDFGYTFNVLEGDTASADIYATLSTGLSVTPSGASADSLISTAPFDPSPSYTLNIVAVSNPTTGGFVTAAFSINDLTTMTQTVSGGTPYTGPVSGLQHQYVNTSADNLNITAGMPNSFIHTGAGFDAIDVSKVGGTNVLDGGTNSNFLVGGTSASSFDTFFVDDRGPASDIWSTVADFHAGDAATVFGITQNGFNATWVDGQGAAGYTGLTLHVTAPGVPTASLTLSGFSSADLASGRLSTSFGTETDGTPYFYVHANS